MKRVKPKSADSFSVDRMMQHTALSLIRDFRRNLNDADFCSNHQTLLSRGDIVGMRQITVAAIQDEPVAVFKARYQIESLMKRYRFVKDTYSDDELRELAIQGFLDTQTRLASVDLDSLDATSQRILDLAASYIAKVLGKYNDEEHRDLCKFGKKASVGVPAHKACLAERWELPITGSEQQIAWFDSEMSHIDCVQEYWVNQLDSDPNRSNYRVTSDLKLTLVPKSYKSFRSIMPNTTIGSYMSYGLGEMIRKRLKRFGYNIKTLQMRHRVLACRASINNLDVTADLSSASDSITVALVNRLFPPDWLEILHQSRIGTVVLPNGLRVESLTFCTMGIGYTFPLQTLVFLALLHAIEACFFPRLNRRHISVYGDDMIYSSRMHHLVLLYMSRFGFVINDDKTFVDSPFRESCGGDYYRGVDVRPFQPRNDQALVGSKTYEAILYKYVNGLLARWSEYEIDDTLHYLTGEICRVAGCCKLVPVDYPDDSGIKCHSLRWDFLQRTRVAHPKHLGHGVYRFSFLRLTPDERKETRHEPYLWDALRGRSSESVGYTDQSRSGSSGRLSDHINRSLSLPGGVCPLKTKEDRPVKTFRSLLTGRRLRRSSTWLTISHTGRYTRQSGFSCFEDRR